MKYDPPVWINHLEQGMQKKSNFFFTATFLLLPITVLFSAVMFIRNRRDIYAFILISAGASFLNALVWAIMIPVDRYLFWGYPLNLLVWLIMFIELVSIFAQRISRHRASLAGGGLSGAPAQWRPARHRQSTAIAQG